MKLVTNYSTLNRNIVTAFERAKDESVGEAKRNAPVSVSRGMKLNSGDVQGGLRASIVAERTDVGAFELRSRFGSGLRYAMQREKGGTILPVRKKLLSWVDPITGERIFAKRVDQRPGGPRQPRPYSPFIGPAGDRFPEFMSDHLRALG
jgi:hypothetical protein